MARRAAEFAAAAVCYFAVARASLLFASINPSATPIWPPTGLALAIVLLRGNGLLPAIALGAFAANLATTPSLAASGCIAVGNTLEAFLGATLLHRWAGGAAAFVSPSGVAKFALIVIAAAAPASATIGVSILATLGLASWDNFFSVWTTWWMGDLAGAILIAPAIVLWASTIRSPAQWRIGSETVVLFATAICVGVAAFSPWSPIPFDSRGALAFLAIAPLLWAALRTGPRDTAFVAFMLSGFAVWGVAAGGSPFSQPTQNQSYLLLVAFIVAVTLPSLALAADRRRIQSALHQTREELLQAQKLEAVGQLTSGVAHDFNNLLMAISAGLRTLERRPADTDTVVPAMRQAVERGAALTHQLLGFAKRAPLRSEVVDLGEVIHGVKTLLAQSMTSTIRLELRTAPDIWPVEIDRGLFELALLNLTVNARHAMPEGGALTISAENLPEGDGAVRVTVADTGHGMPPEIAARAFDPFFTTKAEHGGTGLGLAQVHNFARQAGGSVSIESTPGHGAKVAITLPRARRATAPKSRPTARLVNAASRSSPQHADDQGPH